MGKYGEIAIRAASNINQGEIPVSAWEKASSEIFEPGSSCQKKACPRKAFLGLYGGTGKNAGYAQKALEYLRSHDGIEISERLLWEIATGEQTVAYNSQMDVVLALYKNGLI